MRHLLALLLLSACGSSTPATPPKTAAAPTTAAAPPEPQPTTSLARSDVRAVLKQGPGAFLRHLELDVDHPVFVAGKFHGFRILALHDQAFWAGVDLQPGDVVTRVNGFGVEHPEEVLQAFQSLDVASELRVEYERRGKPLELRFSIIDDQPTQPPQPTPPPKR